MNGHGLSGCELKLGATYILAATFTMERKVSYKTLNKYKYMATLSSVTNNEKFRKSM